jgi:hypothetical protein
VPLGNDLLFFTIPLGFFRNDSLNLLSKMSRDDVKAAKEGFTEDVSRLEEVFQGSYL